MDTQTVARPQISPRAGNPSRAETSSRDGTSSRAETSTRPRPAVHVAPAPLRIRWLGKVAYQDAWALQKALVGQGQRGDNYLLLLEHPHTFTLGANATAEHLLVDPETVGAKLHQVERGGDITYHGPGQLVGYPILSLMNGSAVRAVPAANPASAAPTANPARAAPTPAGGMIHTASYVHSVEQLLIDALAELGLFDVGRLPRYPGVWWRPESDSPEKLAAVGVRLKQGRTMHGFALNVSCDLSWFDKIVPCGIKDFRVGSLERAGLDVAMAEVVDTIAWQAEQLWGGAGSHYQGLPFGERNGAQGAQDAPNATAPDPSRTTPRHQRKLTEAGVAVSLSYKQKKPDWMRAKLDPGPNYWRLKQTMAELDLVTVCEEAGCPNISECWNDGTATFMINGDRCTRSCGFCLVDTRRPDRPDPNEPQNLAQAVRQMQLDYVVLTAVARDDLPDGGAGQFIDCMRAIRSQSPGTAVEVLIPDFRGRRADLEAVFAERPAVLNHNLETVLRLQRLVRPQAGYARSLAVLALAKAAGLTTKCSVMVGLGETQPELVDTMADLAAVGCDILTIGQYLRPTAGHLPIARWWQPQEFEELARIGERLGIGHVEAGPLVRSSYRAAHSATQAGLATQVHPAPQAGSTIQVHPAPQAQGQVAQ